MRLPARSPVLVVLLLAGLVPAPAAAQATATPEAPVLYEDDRLPASFHRSRRDSVRAALPDDAIAVFFGAPQRTRQNDVFFEYRQDSDLLYLTGTHEPGSALLLAPGGVEVDGERVTEVLFVPPRDPAQEVWLGRRFGPERAEEALGVEMAVPDTRFEEIVTPLLSAGHPVFHLPFPEGVPEDSPLHRQLEVFRGAADPIAVDDPSLAALTDALRRIEPARFSRLQEAVRQRVDPEEVEEPFLREMVATFLEADSFAAWDAWAAEHLRGRADGTFLRGLLDRMRMVKTAEELRLLQEAIDITVEAHREAMRSIEPGMAEYEVEALVEYVFKRNGAEYPGFPSIVGSGENAVILHYESNRRTMEGEDMVVMDIGAEYHGYSADVTRTVPVDGSFDPEEKAVYELVLRAQEAGIDAARAGSPFQAPHQAAAAVLAEGLMELGLLEEGAGPQGLQRFFMHGTSHYLGLDVHDAGTYGTLVPNTVITVEPGIYIAPGPDVDERWWNIGVRIEDDVRITEGEPEVMSAGAPRDVAEIEALMGETGLGNEPAGRVGGRRAR